MQGVVLQSIPSQLSYSSQFTVHSLRFHKCSFAISQMQFRMFTDAVAITQMQFRVFTDAGSFFCQPEKSASGLNYPLHSMSACQVNATSLSLLLTCATSSAVSKSKAKTA